MQKITNDLLALAQNGDETAVAALIARMMPAIRKGAAAATAPGLDFEDAVQEGLIGLFEAMHRYDTAAGMAFASFAAACITHAQQDARRAALRKKHAPLNFSVPLPDAKELPQPGPDPEEQAIASEQYCRDDRTDADRTFPAGTQRAAGHPKRPDRRPNRPGKAAGSQSRCQRPGRARRKLRGA